MHRGAVQTYKACRRVVNSFSADTPVVMADGSTKAIADVKVGDLVLATNPSTGVTSGRPVTGTQVNLHDGDLVDVVVRGGGGSGRVQATDGHPFWSETSQRWKPAAELRAGEQLRQVDGSRVTVASLEARPGSQEMWDLSVAVDHTFYVGFGAGSVLVHNAVPNGLRDASDGFKAIFEGGLDGKTIIDIRTTLTSNGFSQGLTNNKSGYLFTNSVGEEVRIMSRDGGWDVRVRNKAKNYLDALGNVAPPSETHGIKVLCK